MTNEFPMANARIIKRMVDSLFPIPLRRNSATRYSSIVIFFL